MELYALEEFLDSGALALIVQLILSPLISIALYVLSAMGLYTIARRRGLHQPWLAWIPVANIWLLGSLSDQYQYVVNGRIKSKRKVLLALNIISAVLKIVLVTLAASAIFQLFMGVAGGYQEEHLVSSALSSVLGMVGLLLPLLGVSIGCMVIRYMALYDVFKSLDPGNAVMFLVLSILFRVTEPFFLCFNRNKDLGMPARRPEPTDYAPPVQEPWEREI